ncbi:MAG: aminotransferase class V-fold PLP-dependent enzyme, partial [Paracoccaceae bacterium]|nr:aminotransferase class V-fold PLP-dependent enzyme [Paracoccaceae bacterium]
MTLSNGRPYLAIPGPSVVPDQVLQAMHRASPDIYEGALSDLTHSLVPDLRSVARTKGDVAMYISNGHGVWEAALSNVVAAGERVLCVATGQFGTTWGVMARGLGIDVELLDFGMHAPLDMDQLGQALADDRAQAFKAVLVSHVDTSTSYLNDVAAVRAELDRLRHPALLMIDCIASLACDRFEMDDWGVDVMVAASQKGLMMPPGLGFVFFNARAAAVHTTMARVSCYWDWGPRSRPELYFNYFNGTAPTHHLFGLRVALDLLIAEGLDQIWARHETLAQTIWAACEAWSVKGDLRLNVQDPAQRSRSVTAASLTAPDAKRLRAWLTDRAGVTLGIGLGMAPLGDPAADGYFRFGHMGYLNAHMVLGMLSSVQAGMGALGIAHGPGGLDA